MLQEISNSVSSEVERRYTFSEFAAILGWDEGEIRSRMVLRPTQEFYSIAELAKRWRCCRGSVYNRLRAAGAKVLDFSAAGRRSKKVVHRDVVLEIEAKKTKRLC